MDRVGLYLQRVHNSHGWSVFEVTVELGIWQLQGFHLLQFLPTSYTPAHILTINIYLIIIKVPNNLYISYLHIRNQRVLTLDKPKTLTINFPITIIILRLSFLLNLTLPLRKYNKLNHITAQRVIPCPSQLCMWVVYLCVCCLCVCGVSQCGV